MTKFESMSIGEFMGRDFAYERELKRTKTERQVKKLLLRTTVTTVVYFSGFDLVSASNGIDHGARIVYDKLLSVGKWIIIIKGGIDTINNVVQGDFGVAKKSFFSYLVVYLILNGLPWAFDEVDTIFNQI